MLEKIKNYFKTKKLFERRGIYNFSEEEKETKKLKKINIFDRIKFIKFNNKSDTVNMRKIKEVRAFSNCSCFSWNRVY